MTSELFMATEDMTRMLAVWCGGINVFVTFKDIALCTILLCV